MRIRNRSRSSGTARRKSGGCRLPESKGYGDFQVERQILIYPALNNCYTEASPYPSVRENGTDYLLTAVKMEDYVTLYESCPEDRQNPYFAPLMETDYRNLPRTLLLTAELVRCATRARSMPEGWKKPETKYSSTALRGISRIFCAWNPVLACAGEFYVYQPVSGAVENRMRAGFRNDCGT